MASFLAVIPFIAKSQVDARPFVHAAPQDGGLYVSWSEVPGATYELQWKSAQSRAWIARRVGTRLTAAVTRLQNGEWADIRVIAWRDNDADTSDLIRARPFKRTDCGTWATRVFCAVDDLAAYLADQGIDQDDLSCDGVRVTHLTASSPNCQYAQQGGGQLFALDRDFSSEFHPPDALPNRAVVRAIARRALWGEGDPFAQPPQEGRLVPSPYASVGGVRAALSARSFSIRVSSTIQSRITWFLPEHPIPGRYAIYHEGHELPHGGAVKSAPEVIDWLLERGWQVVAMDMLLNGENEIDKTYALNNHDDLIREPVPEGADPFTLMLEPVKAVVDSFYARAKELGERPVILMSGRSGGGLVTDIYSAVDDRIDVAVEIAGMSPATSQLDSTLYGGIVNEFDITIPRLYSQMPSAILQTAGGRIGSFHFYSVHDPCCFRFSTNSPFVRYLDSLEKRTGGRVRSYVGSQPMHGVDAKALAQLGRYLADVGLGVGPSTTLTQAHQLR